ncbi:hypothetical protein D3C71_1553070 [compost metagenome]
MGGVHVGKALAHGGDVGVAEHDAQRGAALKACGGVSQRVHARNVAFVGGLVQQGGMGVGVSGQKHGQIAYLLGLWIDGGHAALVQGHPQRLQAQVLDVGHPAHGRDDLVHHHAVVATGDFNAAGYFTQLRFGPHVQHHFLLEQRCQFGVEHWVAQTRQRIARGECGHLQAQPRKGLRNLHPNGAHANHGNARAEGALLEQGVGGEHAVAKREPFFRHAGA